MVNINKNSERENELILNIQFMEENGATGCPEFVKLLNELGSIHEGRHEFSEAEQIYLRSSKAMNAVFDHGRNVQRLRIKTICNLGRVLRLQAKHVKAERIFFKALVIADQSFGPTHIEFARVLRHLGVLYENMGHLNEAKPLYRKALSILDNKLGLKRIEVAA